MILINLIIGFITVIIFYFSTIIPPILMYIWFLSISFVYLGVFSYIWGLCNPLLSTPYIMMNLFIFYIFIFLGFIAIIYFTIGGIGGFSILNIISIIFIVAIVIYLGNMLIPLVLPMEGTLQLLWPFTIFIVIMMIFLKIFI